jgi:hypothetical protein
VERKWKIDEQVFVPRNVKSDDGREKYWTDAAHYWLDDCPTTFRMSVDFDNWKLQKLLSSFESRMSLNEGRLQSVLLDEDESSIQMSLSTILCLLLIASFLPEYPSILIQQTGKLLFPRLQDSSNPFLWNLKTRASFLSLTIGKLQLDAASIVKRTKQKYSLNSVEIDFLTKVVSCIFQSFYPSAQSLDSFEFDLHIPRPDEFASVLKSLIEDDPHYGWMRLTILELLCLGSNNAGFASHFPKLYSIYEASIHQTCSDYFASSSERRPLELKLLLLLRIQKAMVK